MTIEKRFNEILQSTGDGFHDASIKFLNFNFESGDLELAIEHCRYDKSANCDYVEKEIDKYEY